MNEQTKEKLGLLIADIVHGRIYAIDEIYTIMGKVMLSIAYMYFNHKEDAEDCVHDAFITIVKKACKFTKNTNAYAWIITITKRVALNKLKKHKRRKEVSIERAMEVDIGKDEKDKILIREIMSILTAKEQKVIIYKYWYKLSLAEIGEIINKPKTTTHYYINSIEEKIRNYYK